ncbi:RNA-binding protein 44 isoform X2 [Rana temporaria]|uniref:RNA-binding protein 44 isoform X2 n=1 Tax=Rana temporaria TaxID=8407 RepID=UPI001AAD9EEC|nr:RNA-binding protein 44 isoform X2 [Rana temporaria]
MLPFSQNIMPLSYGLTTVAYSVTFPDFPSYYEDLTNIPAPQTCFNSYADKSCRKCKLEKINALKRYWQSMLWQVCEVVKKYDSVEIDGKEVLGWYILLSTEDREIIKEYGNLNGFLKSNPSLLIVNNRLKLKGEPDLTQFARSGEDSCCSLEDNPINTDHKYNADYSEVGNSIMDHSESTDYTVVCSEEMYTHEATNTHSRELVREVVNCKENVWFDQPSFKLQEASSEISKYKYTACASMVLEHKAVPNGPEFPKEKMRENDSSSTNLGTGNYSDNETVNLSHVEPHCSSAKPIDGSNQVTFADHFSSSYVQPDKISHKWEKTITETWNFSDHTEFTKEGIVSGSKRCSDFQDPSQALLEKEGQNVCQQQEPLLDKSEKLLDQECSASDICDETFLSIKSGSYSRSSSPFSIDYHSDTESYLFEEALEDLSSNYLCNQKNDFSVASPDVQSSSLPRAVSVDMNNRPEMTAKQHRNVSCNTDFSWLINCHSDKATQTKGTDCREMDVNTDITFPGIFAQGPVNVGSGGCQDLKDNRGNESLEELKQRVVRAELELLDVQRWMCWQLCWKTQQQSMEQHSFATLHVESAEHSLSMAGFNLLSALTEVEEKYLEIKSQVQSGVPLEYLVPLSMQLTKVKTPPYNLLNQCFMETCKLGIQKGSAGHSEDLQKNKPNRASTCLSTAKDLDKEIREDFPPKFSPEPNKNYVHVGNLALLVTEVELKTAFEKFNVSDIFLVESSVTSSYAVLVFTCSEKAQAAAKEMDGKMFFGKKIKVRVVKNSTENFQFASQEIKVCSATLPKDTTKLGTGEPQSFGVQPEDVSTFSKPIPHSESQISSKWKNRNVFSNIPYNRASSLGVNQSFPSASMYSTSSVFGCIPPSQWASRHLHFENGVPYNCRPSPAYAQYPYPLYAIPIASPFSYQAPVNTPMFKPSVNLNSNVQFLFGKNVGIGVQPQPTEKDPVHSNTVPVSSSTRMSNKNTSTVTPPTRKTDIQPASVITKSSENNGANSESARTKVACVASSISQITTTALKMPVVSDNWLPFENKTTDNSGKTCFTPAAPLRFPKFVPDSVTIPENHETCYSTIATNTKDPLTQPSNTDFQQSGSLHLEEVEWGVYPQLQESSELPVFIPNRLNLRQFEKVTKYLLEHHTDVTRDDIANALEEIRIGREGSLGGLTFPQIVRQASSKLAAKNIP